MVEMISGEAMVCPSTRVTASPFSRLEWEAIRIGIREGDAASRVGFWAGPLRALGAKTKPLADAWLETLRASAEAARMALAHGREMPMAMLADAGFSSRQIAALTQFVGAFSWATR